MLGLYKYTFNLHISIQICKIEARGKVQNVFTKLQISWSFLFSPGSILSIHGINGEMSSKIGASAILSADELCNIHYVIYISGYGDSSSAYKTINSVLKLDGVFDRGRRSSRGIALAGFNRNYIVSNFVRKLRYY